MLMTNNDDLKTLASFNNCLSLLETNVYLLYKNLSEKVEECREFHQKVKWTRLLS